MFTFIICAVAGLGAGIATGFAGLSAAVFIVPMLVTFLDVSSYEAIGIALASDVLASAVSTITYARHGNIDIKRSLPLFITIIIFTILGSIAGYYFTSFSFGETAMSYWTVIIALALGVKFLFRPVKQAREGKDAPKKHFLLSVLCGIYIGIVCGFQGTGGGMMMLFALTLVLGYGFKVAVGTSVFIMTLTALIGAGSHFAINGLPDLVMLGLCAGFTLIGSLGASLIANRIHAVHCNRATGIILVISGIIMLWTQLAAETLSETLVLVIDICLIVLACLAAILLIIYCFVFGRHSKAVCRLVAKSGNRKDFLAARTEAADALHAVPHEDLYVISDRGTRLHGYFYPADAPSDKFVILVHGYLSEAMECCGLHYGYYHDLGYNVLCTDNNGAGKSRGIQCGFAAYESKDTLLWADRLTELYGERITIILHGFSLGGASVLKCADCANSRIRGIVSDSGYASAVPLLKSTLHFLYPVMNGMVRLIGNYSLKKDTSPLENLKNADRPVLLFFGEKDRVISAQDSYALMAQCPEKTTAVVLHESGHIEGIFREHEKYLESLRPFLDAAAGENHGREKTEKEKEVHREASQAS